MSGDGRTFALAMRDEVVDLGEQVLLPGLINAHCHLDYTALRGAIPPPASRSRPGSERSMSARPTLTRGGLSRASIASRLCRGGELRDNDDRQSRGVSGAARRECRAPPLRTWWFAEMIDVREPQSAARDERGNARRSSNDRAIGWAESGSHRMRLLPRPRRFTRKRPRSRRGSICR